MIVRLIQQTFVIQEATYHRKLHGERTLRVTLDSKHGEQNQKNVLDFIQHGTHVEPYSTSIAYR